MLMQGLGTWLRRSVGAACLGVMGAAGVLAEPLDYFLVEGVRYNPDVLKPRAVFGHDLGDQPSRHDLMVDYIRRLADASPRMQVETIGYSHERRPILFITVSHPDNLARLDEIRSQHLARLAPGAEQNADLPAITWVNYGVHGAEASGMDAAIPTLYHLAAAEDAVVEEQLKHSVILITAVFNPDGHSRRAAWVTQYRSDVVNRNPSHEIHHHAWPGGRTNHYWFDLNRQWLLQTQPESRAWLAKWHEWKPQVSADFHEMGSESTYYFHPGVPTRKFPLIPARGRELLVEISKYHARALDAAGELYFTEEGFDNFYVGKGSTYPQVNGGLGILFEAGAQMGLERESAQGVKTFARNIRTHMRTSLSTIEGAAAMRAPLAEYQQQFFRDGLAQASDDRIKGYVFRAPEDPARVAHFLDLMQRHDVAVYPLTETVRADGVAFGPESYVVPLNQPQYRMIKSMFDRYTEFPDKVFYDVSGWTLPLAYGLEYAEVRASLRGKYADTPADAVFAAAPAPDPAPYAYVMRWSDYYAPRALGRVLSSGVMARVALKPVVVTTTRGDVAFEEGAIIVALDRQRTPPEQIHAIMEDIAAEDGIRVHAATSGLTPSVGVDLGGRNSVRDLVMPNPLLVIGQGMNAYDAGEVWHQLDHRMQLPVTLVRRDRLSSIDLDHYTHVILVGGRGAPFSASQTDALKSWIRDGGTLIASRQGADWAAHAVLGHKDEQGDSAGEPARLSYAEKTARDAEHVVGGALFESRIDRAHPMAFGYRLDQVATHRNTSIILPVPKDPYARVAVYSEAPLLSGYASDARVAEIAGTPMMTAERMGGGSVVLFADNPNFRATYRGAEKLFLNALFFSRAFDRSFAGDEADAHAHEE